MQTKIKSWKVPPFEKNGRGIPVTGIIPIVIPTFSKIWIKISPAMPVTNRLIKVLFDDLAIFINLNIRMVNKAIIIIAPINPSSSAKTENIKSVSFSGI